jgi:hypothetical protein
MKYKCLKDYWMQHESEDNGDIPAFAAGDEYEFFVRSNFADGEPYLYTPRDNQRAAHYMDDNEEFNEYFELVE